MIQQLNIALRGSSKKAKPVLEKLIRKNPTVSEYHRILGQIYSDEGSQDKAVNCLIDALRWDPRNSHALIMMGLTQGERDAVYEAVIQLVNQRLNKARSV